MDTETILTDVLIIGGGGAGLRAAIEAERYGAHATLVSKIKAGTNNSTALAAGVTTYSYEEFIDELFRLVVTEGGFLNDQRLVEVFVKDAAWRIPELRSFGVTLKLLEKEKLAYFNPRNPVPLFMVSRTPETRNLGLTQPLRATAEGLGAKILDDVLVTKLLTNGKAVAGAIALSMKEDKLLVISAKSTILANGGGDQALLRPDTESTFGFGRRATGDGYSLAYNAGAELMDMEFVTFNMRGHKLEKISTENYVQFVENATKGIERNNARWDFDPISPHYFYGGVRIDEWGKTSLDNLYAAGEVAGGVFGAGRMGGSALADIIVFGARAGESAAKDSKNTEHVHPEKVQVDEEKQRLQTLLEQKSGSISPAEFKQEIRSITWNYAAIAKTKELLAEGLDQLKAVEAKKTMLHAKNGELSDAIEALNMLDVARMVMMPALMRTESRGSHWRVDCPSPDNKNWLKNIFIIKDKDMILTTRPVATTRLSAPIEVRLGVGGWSGYFKITPA